MPPTNRPVRRAVVVLATGLLLALALAGPASAAEVLKSGGPASAAAAKKVNYAGTTKEGTEISFFTKGGWVDGIRSRVPTSCVSAQGGPPVATIDLFYPPFKYKLGTKGTGVATEPWPTRHYTFESRRSGRKIKGKLSLSYSKTVPASNYYGYRILTCWGTASFTAKQR